MKVYIVYKEYLNWAENNGTEIVNVYDSSDNAKKVLEKIYEEEMQYLKEEEYKIVAIKMSECFAEISTVYGDIKICISCKEVK